MSFSIQLGRKKQPSDLARDMRISSVFLPPKIVPTIEGTFAVESRQELEALIESLVGAGKAFWPAAAPSHAELVELAGAAGEALSERAQQQRAAGG